METITIPKGFKVTPEQFDQLASAEQLVRMELTKKGELIIMSPTGGEAGRKNRRLTQQMETVEIYRLGYELKILNHPQTLSGENILPGFVLDLSEI
ncbi:hypothetical protein cce_0143 [Crocosphaera subtropica ATCC 51142]|uniref:Uncharacterized protein n=1 Tax=Crocosphaera subtropica (strain ATCC 51142 / BH68) TaxID=43989 RepID=B1WZC9_CROS5|nr:Uma2 family endonuclease [Crocosphaera subtropica]ACB49495.1 hypothetical protein cce_0143 [Crocosphaera subtropica ATCC 51142]